MSEPWDPALRGAARALGLGMWRLNFGDNSASWDPQAAELLDRPGPESALSFLTWLKAGVAKEGLPRWATDEEWVSSPLKFRSADRLRYLRLAGRREGQVWQGSVQEITQEMMLTQRVVQAERMEAIGRFSAGIAHNFNNMLTIMIACLADAEERLADQDSVDAEVLRDIADAQDAARRATKVVQSLGRLTQAAKGERSEVCELEELCTGAVEGLRRVAVDGLQINHSVQPDLCVRQPPGTLEQVLNNLLLNANYAVRTSERPTIWLRAVRSDAFGVPTVEITVSDNGPGVPPEIEPDLFQPFVTSKGNKGTGLGLATASEALRKMGGQLAYRAREGGGAEFVVVLPLLATPPAKKPKPLKVSPRQPGDGLAGRRVLVVDDEPVILRLVKHILEREGATVTTAANLSSARAALEPAHDAVLLDQTLGPERGLDLLPELRAASRHTRVLFFSGEPVKAEVLALVDAVVAKPVGRAALVDALKRSLAQVPNN